MTQLHRFPTSPPRERRMSPMPRDARRTVRAEVLISIGRHPVNGLPTDHATTCGGCAHHVRRSGSCLQSPTMSEVRASWPGCPYWDQK